MNMFQFAIASIVDANTGNGLIHDSGRLDYVAAENHGRKIRAKSIAALMTSIKSRFSEVFASYRAAAKQRRELRILLSLNDHLLDDIGISRFDLHAVALGATTLDELKGRYRSERRAEQGSQREFSATDKVDLEFAAINEQFFDSRKCA